MRTRGALPAALFHAIVILGGGAAEAQQPTPVTATPRADSLAELTRLDSLVATRNSEARVWHARGLLAWQLSQGRRAIGLRVDGEQLRLNRTADSSLLAAVTLEPTNVRYLVDVAMYRSQGSPIVRAGATRWVKRAFEAARAGSDSMAVAEMADALGMVEFKDYQMFFGRRMYRDNGPGRGIAEILNQQSGADGRSVSASADLVRHAIEERSVPLGGSPPPGTDAFDRALVYFETATTAAAALPRPWRHRFAALADRMRWEELESAARHRVTVAPWDPDAWLALGLAQHRQGSTRAMAAFDSAWAQMTDSTRVRLDKVERIMHPRAARMLDSLPSDERARTARFVWTAADPLWTIPGNQVRAEYLARVAFAELRFTDDEKGLHGVDTYPGDLHVRFGFPKVTMNYECGDVCWFWWYAPRVQFVVRYVAAFNRGLSFSDDVAGNLDIQFQVPATFTSVPGVPAIDSIPLRVARFRPDGAHPTVFVSGTIPLAKMAEGGVRAATAVANLWIISDGADAVGRDSVRTDAAGLALWKVRAAYGDLFARAEAVLPGAGAARGTAYASAPSSIRGFGMSDVIIAAAVADGAAPATRWHEFVITPAPDTLPGTRGIAIAWEAYGLSVKDGMQRYAVSLVLEKASKSVAGRIVAQIGGLVRAQRGNDKVTLGFERDGTARDVAPDHVSLSLREAPAGQYNLTVEITDRNSGARTSRRVVLLIGT